MRGGIQHALVLPEGSPGGLVPGAPPPPPGIVSGERERKSSSRPSNCPPGLEYLNQIDMLKMEQQVEMVEALIGFEQANRYNILNMVDQRVFLVAEDSDCCSRACCGARRPFKMKIFDNAGQEVIRIKRPLRCTSCLCACNLQEMEVEAPPGQIIGLVTQQWNPCRPSFAVRAFGISKDPLLWIEGPACTWAICGDLEFVVRSKDKKHKVAKIFKLWSGAAKELLTDADNYGISFPKDLDVRVKAILIAACILLDYMYFEISGVGGGGDVQL